MKWRSPAYVFWNLVESSSFLVMAGVRHAQHISAELVGRYMRERQAFAAIALATNTSNLTAIGKDYSYEEVFSRQIEAIGSKRHLVPLYSF
jgi:phosphoheptose isomerase